MKLINKNNTKMENLINKDTGIEANTITFNIKNEHLIKLCPNGDIFVKGKLVENDLEVVEGMREFLKRVNF